MKNVKVFPVITALAMGFTLVGCRNNDNSKGKTKTSNSTTITSINTIKKEYNYADIRIIIENNNNLTREEKDFLNKLQFIFDEYHEYMDIELIKERLKTLSIEYHKEYERNNQGEYNSKKNKIHFVGVTCFKEVKKNVFLHEFLHVLQSCDTWKYFTNELSNEFFSLEIYTKLYFDEILSKEEFYNDKTSDINNEREWQNEIFDEYKLAGGYMYHTPIYYILAEILPKDVLCKYQFNPSNIEILRVGLINATQATYDETTKIDNLINHINDLRKIENNEYIYTYPDEEIYNELNYFYKKIKNKNIEEDLSLSLRMAQYNIFSIFRIDTNNYYNKIEKNVEKFLEEEKKLTILINATAIHKTFLSNSQPNTYMLGYDNNYNPIQIIITEELQQEYAEYIKNINKTKTK